jgi:hypothetical protein
MVSICPELIDEIISSPVRIAKTIKKLKVQPIERL